MLREILDMIGKENADLPGPIVEVQIGTFESVRVPAWWDGHYIWQGAVFHRSRDQYSVMLDDGRRFDSATATGVLEFYQDNVSEWRGPKVVLDKPAPRIFLVDEHSGDYRELTEAEANSPASEGEEDWVPTEVVEANGEVHLKCLCYYSNAGVFEMRITRPLDQAMKIYMAALRADGNIG